MDYTRDNQQSSERVELTGMLAEFREALEDEIAAIKKNGQSFILLHSGQKIDSYGEESWYRFRIKHTLSFPADIPCKLLIGNSQYDITIINYDESSITISTKSSLPVTINKAILENVSTILIKRMITCIEENAETNNSVGMRMLSPDRISHHSHRIFTYEDLTLNCNNTPSQNDAIVSALSNDITFIWGPPGTGKTSVIGQIINELYKHNRTALVLSHTNAATDGAIEKADLAYYSAHTSEDTAYPILRIGLPSRPMPSRVLLPHHVAFWGKKWLEQKVFLEQQQFELNQRLSVILPLIAKAVWVNGNKLNLIKDLLQNIKKCTEATGTAQNAIDKIKVKLQQEKSAHPEYRLYSDTLKIIEQKKSAFSAILEQINNERSFIHALSQRVQYAQNEIEKHCEYEQLCAQESRSMSIQFLQNEISATKAHISSLNTKISDLKATQAAAQQVIENYEKRGAITKLLFRKSAVSQAQITLRDTNIKLPKIESELLQLHNLLQEYTHRLDMVVALKQQIKANARSLTKNHWEKELVLLQAKITQKEAILNAFNAQLSLLRKEICDIERELDNIKSSFDTIRNLEGQLCNEEKHLERIQSICTTNIKRCSEYLAEECSCCNAFHYTPTESENAPLFEELSRLLIAVKDELSSSDIDLIREEKGVIEKQLTEISYQLREIAKKEQECEKQAIMNAKIIGTTLTTAYLHNILRERKFDTVIFDEASMASIPILWCASYLAEKNIVIIGDFLQLPPIVMATTPIAQKWLGKDIFYHSGMQELAKCKDLCPDTFIMLNDQFRMESDIADLSNIYYGAYGGLHSHDTAEFRVRERENFYKWYSGKRTNHNIHLVDTESLHAWVTSVPQGKSRSRMNCFSAAVDVGLAFKFLENKLAALDPATATPVNEASVIIIAPYKPQITRLKQLIELEYHDRGFQENLNLISAGTIHSFQGSEADIVIFDLVIDEPHRIANLFMADAISSESLRKMFNVAITRAKFKLYIVGNFNHCQKYAKNNPLSDLLDILLVKNHLPKIDAKLLLPSIIFSKQPDFAHTINLDVSRFICKEESFSNCFIQDIASFKKRLIIFSPFMTKFRLSVLLPAFVDAIHLGKQIIVVTKAIEERRSTELAQYQLCEQKLRDIGVHIFHKRGMHEKLIFIDREAVWLGSLNALSFTGETGEIMERNADRDITAWFEKLNNIDLICRAIEIPHERNCPICGGEMLIMENNIKGPYWQCINRDYSRPAAERHPKSATLHRKFGVPHAAPQSGHS